MQNQHPIRRWYSFRYGWHFWIVIVVILYIIADLTAVLVPAIQSIPETELF